MIGDRGHDTSGGAGIRRVVLADEGDFCAACIQCFRHIGASDYAAVEPNSGTASLSMALMVTRSSFAMACSSVAIHLRSICIGGSLGLAAMMPATPISTAGSSLANRISFSRSPGRMPENTISISWPGSRPGQADHALGQIDDLDRMSHVEHVNRDIAARRRQRMGRRRQHEIAGLANGHEIPDHVGMRHRHRPARLDLRLEFRHHRSVRRQHVAEPHGDKRIRDASPDWAARS